MNEHEEQKTAVPTRKSRKSLIRQIEETQAEISAELSGGKNTKPSRTNLLAAKLQSQMALLEREDEQKQNAVVLENEALKKEIAVFKELNIMPHEVAALREENGIINTRLETLQVNARNDAATIASQQKEIETLKKNLVYAAQSVSDPLFAMRSFVALKGEARDECLNGAKVREWLQCEMAYPSKEKMLAYLRDNRARGCDLQIGYCYARLQVEHGMTSTDCEKLFTEQDEKQAKEKFARCMEAQIREAKEATMRGPRGIAGDQEWNPEWRQPVPVRVEQPPISGSSMPFSPWVK